MKHHHTIRGYLIAGLLIWLPILATLYVMFFLVNLFDMTLDLIPDELQPQVLLGFHLPGLGLIFSLLVLLLTGALVTNFLGNKLILYGEKLLERIPLVRTIYKSVKQVLETIFTSNSDSFRKVLLVEYPRKGLWSIAFQTGSSTPQIVDRIGEEVVTVFIPTTPNPTSGFLIMVPVSDVRECDLSIDEALKIVISLGVVQPSAKLEENIVANP
jgi:uncharacterized membrane protein